MTDVMTPQQRSRCMSRIRGRDTKPERLLRSCLWSNGLRYRLRYPITGKPDIVFPSAKLAVFVDGCFWHGCPVHGTQPKNREVFWKEKILRNKKRDTEVNKKLRSEGWIVKRYWEHQINQCVEQIASEINAVLAIRK